MVKDKWYKKNWTRVRDSGKLGGGGRHSFNLGGQGRHLVCAHFYPLKKAPPLSSFLNPIYLWKIGNDLKQSKTILSIDVSEYSSSHYGLWFLQLLFFLQLLWFVSILLATNQALFSFHICMSHPPFPWKPDCKLLQSRNWITYTYIQLSTNTCKHTYFYKMNELAQKSHTK